MPELMRALKNAVSLVDVGSALSVVLQLPCETKQQVSASKFHSILMLKEHFSLVDPAALGKKLAARGFEIGYTTTRSVAAGKRLWMGIFNRL
jgi:hypothetical protein